MQWFVDEQLKCEAAAEITTLIVAVEKEGGSETGTIPSTEETARVIGEHAARQHSDLRPIPTLLWKHSFVILVALETQLRANMVKFPREKWKSGFSNLLPLLTENCFLMYTLFKNVMNVTYRGD